MKAKPVVTTQDLQILIDSASNDIEYLTPSKYTQKVQRCIERVERAMEAKRNAKLTKRIKQLRAK